MLTGDGHGVVDEQRARRSRERGQARAAPAVQHGLSLGSVRRRHLDRRPARLAAGDHRQRGRAASTPANTGFGYGDDTSVALGERLVGLYAKALDGKVSVGRALMIAKQQYAASTAVLGPYDEKVLQESVFYGLPLYNLAGSAAVHAARTPRCSARGIDLRRHDQRHRPADRPAGRAGRPLAHVAGRGHRPARVPPQRHRRTARTST